MFSKTNTKSIFTQERSENNRENNSLKKQHNLAKPMTLVSFDKLLCLHHHSELEIDDSPGVAASNSRYFNFLREGIIL